MISAQIHGISSFTTVGSTIWPGSLDVNITKIDEPLARDYQASNTIFEVIMMKLRDKLHHVDSYKDLSVSI